MSSGVHNDVQALASTGALLRFRSDLRVFDPHPDDRDGRYTVYDPTTDLSYFLGKGELLTARLFDGRRTLEDIAECMKTEYRSVIALDKLSAFGRRLAQYGLLEEPGVRRKRRFWDPAMGISYGPLKALLMITVLRMDPKGMLDFLYRRCRWLCSPFFAHCGLAVMLMALASLGLQHEAFARDVAAVYSGAGWLLWHYPVVVISIFFHEVGHALTCRLYRVRVTDFGIAVYLLLATGWARPLQRDWDRLERRQRLTAILMGPYASLLFASVGVLLWQMVPAPGALHTLGIIMAVSASVALIPTLLPMFNGDTYLAITELIGVPRLRQRAFRYVRNVLRGQAPDEPVTGSRRLLYWCAAAGSVLGWLLAWLLLMHLVFLIFPAVFHSSVDLDLGAAGMILPGFPLQFFSPT